MNKSVDTVDNFKLTKEQIALLKWLYVWHSGGDEYVFVPMVDMLHILGITYEIKDGKLELPVGEVE